VIVAVALALWGLIERLCCPPNRRPLQKIIFLKNRLEVAIVLKNRVKLDRIYLSIDR